MPAVRGVTFLMFQNDSIICSPHQHPPRAEIVDTWEFDVSCGATPRPARQLHVTTVVCLHVTRHQVVALDVTLAVTTIVSVSGDAVSGECHEPAHNKCPGSDFKRSEAFCSNLPSTKWLTHLADCSAPYSDSEY